MRRGDVHQVRGRMFFAFLKCASSFVSIFFVVIVIVIFVAFFFFFVTICSPRFTFTIAKGSGQIQSRQCE